ncbi:uncharacterized protein FOMMEDRAFT_152462 [Fomitiporia mediterranea MF3/22]|uniref:uncharacterized protein n=1 Tax=Fomitiporia mediterranea (strain MF3/22) TaxID=694068 RepID=UPI000440868B|nr:uncharacterized protein FOMMEDRAFT_152462 [Fomitiporia mediterranea MF3/22]EJD07104.1 hypothetical protein FOMMEDRAFT_152462 [Fomitiporia mediterranea MF3/22]
MANQTLDYAYTLFNRSDAIRFNRRASLVELVTVVSDIFIAKCLNVALLTALIYHTRSYCNFSSYMILPQEPTCTTFQVITIDKQIQYFWVSPIVSDINLWLIAGIKVQAV